MMVQAFAILLITICSSISAERILVLFCHTGPSHFYSFYPLFDSLAERGHNVTVLTYNHVENHHKNYNELLLSGLPTINSSIKYEHMWPLDRSILTMHVEFFELYNLAEIERNAVLNSPQIDRILAEHDQNPFDVVLTELFLSDFALGLIYKLNVPFIGFSSCALPQFFYDRVSMPDIPAYIPFAFSGFSFKMNFSERVINWLTVKLQKFLFSLIQIRDNQELRARFGFGFPGVEEISKNTSIILVNQHFSYAGPKPLSNQIIEVGGIHLKPPKTIPQNFIEFLDNANQGVILVSWGSNVESASIPETRKKEILAAFSKLPQNIIWKWENDSIKDIAPKNVFVSKWIPQKDILCHPNVKLFWTHGGNLATIETVHCGKPAMITPFYGDQYLNAMALAERGLGFVLPLEEITAKRIIQIVDKALSSSAVESAQKVSHEFNHRLNSPLKTAVWWVEHVIATNGFELGKTNTPNMNWFSYHSIDAFFVVMTIILLLIFGIIKLFIFCCKNHIDQSKKNN